MRFLTTLVVGLSLALAATEASAAEQGGVGCVVFIKNASVEVARVVPGSPAARAGITRGTRIVAIDGRPVAGVPLAEVAGLLRGEPGTEVRLRLEPPLREVALVRAPF